MLMVLFWSSAVSIAISVLLWTRLGNAEAEETAKEK